MRPAGRRRIWIAAALAGCLLAACGGSSGRTTKPAGAPGPASLATAVARLNTTRAAVLRDVARVEAGVAGLAGADAAAAAGRSVAVQARRAALHRGARAAGRAVHRLHREVAAYARAVAALTGASLRGLSQSAAQAVHAVTAAGAGEQAALASYATTVQQRVWPAYDPLPAVLLTWAEHATWGWFATTRQAAGAYAAARPSGLAAAGRELAAADGPRVRADAAMSRALRGARTVLAAR